jgi:stringent starvation protein B
MTSSRPYLIRAMYEWIADNNFTPHLVVDAMQPHVQVPEKYIEDGKIVLNISVEATQKLLMNNQAVEFDARFSGAVWHVYVPVQAVIAIYAKENGRGMIFEEELDEEEGGNDGMQAAKPEKSKTSKPHLKIVK